MNYGQFLSFLNQPITCEGDPMCTANVYRQMTDELSVISTKKSSKVHEFKNDRQMFAFLAAR